MGIWESIYNPEFNYGKFAIIKSQAGLNSYKISVKEWVAKTNAIGLRASAGRHGGTYAHKDIAFEFGMWISAEFKIYLIREFQRLKEEEHILPPIITKEQASFTYASEADLLNVALFGKTAQQWRKENPKEKGNMRDYASLEQLIVLSNIESINALLISQTIPQGERLVQLNKVAITQMKSLFGNRHMQAMAALNTR